MTPMLYRNDIDLGLITRRVVVKADKLLGPKRTSYFVSTYRLVLTPTGLLRWRAVDRSAPMTKEILHDRYGRQLERGELPEGALNNAVVGHYERGKLKLEVDVPLGEQFWKTLAAATGADPVKLSLQR